MVKVLIASNLDSRHPFGQFTRPYFLGAGIAGAGHEVANVGLDCSRVTFGPSWSIGHASLRRFGSAITAAVRRFRPDVVYAHQNLPAAAAVLAARATPVAADFHSIPSVEWLALGRGATPGELGRYLVAAAKARAAERFVARRADLVIAASTEMAEEVARRYAPRATPVAVPNGVDPTLLDAAAPLSTPFAAGTRNVVATIPTAASPSNRRALDFLREATLALGGGPGTPAVHVLGSADGPAAPGLHYQGFQEDLLPWMDRADVCALPYPERARLYGGARNKLLEYLARGRTLVTTTEGLRGLEEAAAWPGVSVTADDPAEFAAALRAAADPDAPRLDDERDLVHRLLRWDILGQRAADALARFAGDSTEPQERHEPASQAS